MIRWSVLAAGAAVVVGAAFVTGASIPPKPSVAVEKSVEVPATVLGQKTGYFNMPKVMKEYKRAQLSVAKVNDDTKRALAQLTGMRDMFIELKTKMEQTEDEEQKFRINSDMRALARMIEDFDRVESKKRNELAAVLIPEFYDEVHAVVVEMAKAHGLHAVLTFPDAPSPAEMEMPQLKEAKLKPPACQPFYLDPSVDYTDELIQRLNAKFVANGGK
ncbi:MAG: OmpH family outer membrane protein [Planctomycetes bacterium]|nr:OmpH family outer membrane protein [Planctomycetota bacterium]